MIVRRATSMVELVVVIAIVGLLLAILLASVQAVRISAARTECANNIRQIALACQNYHECFRLLPPGCSNTGPLEAQPHMSWLTRLLPFIEQSELWNQSLRAYELDKFFENAPHRHILGKPMRQFLCPLDAFSHVPWSFGEFTVAFTDYLGVEGLDLRRNDGVLYLNSKTNLISISDGLSCTLMIGERPPSSDHNLGWWYAGWGQNRTGSAEMVLGVREIRIHRGYLDCPEGPYLFQPGSIESVCGAFHFWSLHPGGANFAFCDGSVRFLAYSADPIMPVLATRAGGEAVSVPE